MFHNKKVQSPLSITFPFLLDYFMESCDFFILLFMLKFFLSSKSNFKIPFWEDINISNSNKIMNLYLSFMESVALLHFGIDLYFHRSISNY